MNYFKSLVKNTLGISTEKDLPPQMFDSNGFFVKSFTEKSNVTNDNSKVTERSIALSSGVGSENLKLDVFSDGNKSMEEEFSTGNVKTKINSEKGPGSQSSEIIQVNKRSYREKEENNEFENKTFRKKTGKHKHGKEERSFSKSFNSKVTESFITSLTGNEGENFEKKIKSDVLSHGNKSTKEELSARNVKTKTNSEKGPGSLSSEIIQVNKKNYREKEENDKPENKTLRKITGMHKPVKEERSTSKRFDETESETKDQSKTFPGFESEMKKRSGIGNETDIKPSERLEDTSRVKHSTGLISNLSSEKRSSTKKGKTTLNRELKKKSYGISYNEDSPHEIAPREGMINVIPDRNKIYTQLTIGKINIEVVSPSSQESASKIIEKEIIYNSTNMSAKSSFQNNSGLKIRFGLGQL